MTTAAPAGATLDPRDYQQDAIDAVFDSYNRGIIRQVCVMPTASGKTVVFCYVIQKWGWKTVIIVHREELVEQTLNKLKTIAPGLSVGIVKAGKDQTKADIVIASAQTIARTDRLARLVEDTRDIPLLVISDECHHDPASTRKRAIDALAPDLLLGVTATPKRADGVRLDSIYQEIVYQIGMLDLMYRGFLAPLVGLRIDADADLDTVRSRYGEFAEGDLSRAVNTDARNQLIVESFQRHASDRTRTIAFCVDKAHARDLADTFVDAGIKAEVILGETTKDERDAIYSALRAGDLPVVTNCNVLTEGFDEPSIDCILMARPTKSESLYIQMAGRGARLSGDTNKTDCLLIDFVDSTTRHKLVTFPTLAGSKHSVGVAADYRRDGETMRLIQPPGAEPDMEEVAAVAVNLYGSSAYLWQQYKPLVRFAKAGQNAWIVLEEDPKARGFWPVLLHEPGFGAPAVMSDLAEFALPDLGYAMAKAEAAAAPFAAEAKFDPRKSSSYWEKKQAPSEKQEEWLDRNVTWMQNNNITRPQTRAAASMTMDRRIFEVVYGKANRRYGKRNR